MLCSLGHDDIQYWLCQPENRLKLRNQLLGPTFKNKKFVFANYTKTFDKEVRFKPPYEPEEFYDGLEFFGYDKEPPTIMETTILYEIKPELKDLGQTLRQLHKYISHIKPAITILIYNSSKINQKIITDFFDQREIKIYQLLPKECKRLEELQ